MLILDTMGTNCISEIFKRTTTLWSKSAVSTLGTNCNPRFFRRDHPKSAVSTLGTNCNPRFFLGTTQNLQLVPRVLTVIQGFL